MVKKLKVRTTGRRLSAQDETNGNELENLFPFPTHSVSATRVFHNLGARNLTIA